MNIFYIIGVVVVIIFVAGFFGLCLLVVIFDPWLPKPKTPASPGLPKRLIYLR